MKKVSVLLVVVLLIVSVTSFAFAAHYPMVTVDHNMETSYNTKKPNATNGPMVCKYTAGSLSNQSISSETWISIATDETGSANVYMKGANGVIKQKANAFATGGYVKSGVATINGCYSAEYVEHRAVRTYHDANGDPTYADDWGYRFE